MLLALPSVPIDMLLGDAPSASFIGRLTGAALLAIGLSSWVARNDSGSPAQTGLLVSVVTYDVAAAALLAYGGLFLGLTGIALWPAVVVHAAMAVWGVVCLATNRKASVFGAERVSTEPRPVQK